MSDNQVYILRLRIYQPQAHYRVFFTYRRRHTYPIPPYSTVIGFLCNVLGYDGMPSEHSELRKLKISIAGCFESKTTEYIWFRSLAKSDHIKRFGAIESRDISGHVEHIGGQIPILIDVLNNVHLVIHFAHEDYSFLKHIRSSLENPIHRLEVLHLGRAEDWIVIEELSEILDLSSLEVCRVDGNFKHFFWIPERLYLPEGMNKGSDFECYEGIYYRLPTFWTVENYTKTYNRHGRRIFEYITVKLSDGLFKEKTFLYDRGCKLPIFLANFEGGL
ncbi:MAG: type I-B CRISPR-associated protein Cas5b [Brevinematia bacterium]